MSAHQTDAEVDVRLLGYYPCEVCLKPATQVCSGLDVAPWRFCDVHMSEHIPCCEDLKNGRADGGKTRIVWLDGQPSYAVLEQKALR